MRLSAAVGPEARRSPHSVAVASSSSAGTTSLISPQASAVSASIGSPKNAICLARRIPTDWGSDHEAPPSSARPRFTKISLNVARSLATMRSHAIASPRPTPTATPSTAAMVGFDSRFRRETIWPTMRISLRTS